MGTHGHRRHPPRGPHPRGPDQAELASRAATSQATVSAYENGRKQPSIETLERVLAATGSRLTVAGGGRPVIVPGTEERVRIGRELVDVIALAAALPTRHERRLRFPRLGVRGS